MLVPGHGACSQRTTALGSLPLPDHGRSMHARQLQCRLALSDPGQGVPCAGCTPGRSQVAPACAGTAEHADIMQAQQRAACLQRLHAWEGSGAPACTGAAEHASCLRRLYAWEEPFQAQITALRGKELRFIRRAGYLQVANVIVFLGVRQPRTAHAAAAATQPGQLWHSPPPPPCSSQPARLPARQQHWQQPAEQHADAQSPCSRMPTPAVVSPCRGPCWFPLASWLCTATT